MYVYKMQHVVSYPMSKVVGEREVARKRVGEGMVELQHFQKTVTFDRVQVAVRQRAHVRRGLAVRALLPEVVTKHVAFA